MAKHHTNSIIKFADDTTVIGLITNNNEDAYRDEVRDLSIWCQNNSLSLNVDKTKELIIDFRKTKSVKLPVLINKPVEIVPNFKGDILCSFLLLGMSFLDVYMEC